MQELLDKCTQDQLVQFANNCADQAEKYATYITEHEYGRRVELAGFAAERALNHSEYTARSKSPLRRARFTAYHAREAAHYASTGRAIERQRQMKFLTDMLEQDK